MGIIDLKSNLKNLGFGKDRPGGGSSSEPYVVTPIPDNSSPFSLGSDFLLRENSLKNSALDVSRITQFMFDLKSPKGYLFTAKQNLLSLINVKTEANLGIANGGIYLPSNTISQVGVTAFGTHLNRQGIDPTGLFSSFNTYEDVVRNKNQGDARDNRLVALTKTKINNLITIPNLLNGISPSKNELFAYQGGPNSNAGVGFTRIKIASDRTGKNNPNLINLGFYGRSNDFIDDYSVFSKPDIKLNKDKIFMIGAKLPSISLLYKKLTGIDVLGDSIDLNRNSEGFYNFSTNVYTPFSAGTFPEMSGREKDNNSLTFTQQNLIDTTPQSKTGEILEDFRKKLIDDNSITTSTILSISPSYKTKNIGNRVNVGDPGLKKDVFNYGISALDMQALDKLSALPIYEDTQVKQNADSPTNDLIKFRISTLNNENNKKTFIHFRAFLTSFNDNFESKWGSTTYSGRGDEFHNYEGFNRSISLTFKIYVQSKAELIPVYSKLNYLQSTLTPDYTKAGFMRGNIHQLTVGGYLYEQNGFIKSLNYEIPQESPWEIGINENGDYDSSVKELPLMINVNMNFTPIHNFVPRKDTNYQGNPSSKFISLSTGNGDNYEDIDSYKTYPKT